MSSATLHYIYDPLCGWCYAISPLIKAAREFVAIELHGGGMMTGDQIRRITPAWRDYVGPQDRRIGRATGQIFGEAYLNGLLNDTSAVLDSGPPTAAVIAATEISGNGLDMLARVQKAHYVEGRRVADLEVLSGLATEVGLDEATFSKALQSIVATKLASHFTRARKLLASVGGSGFPTLALERDGAFQRLDHGAYLGRPELWKAVLEDIRLSPAIQAAAAAGCGPNGCAI